jgi:hypothetical protein
LNSFYSPGKPCGSSALVDLTLQQKFAEPLRSPERFFYFHDGFSREKTVKENNENTEI